MLVVCVLDRRPWVRGQCDRLVALGVFAHCNQEVTGYWGDPGLVRRGQSEEGERTRRLCLPPRILSLLFAPSSGHQAPRLLPAEMGEVEAGRGPDAEVAGPAGGGRASDVPERPPGARGPCPVLSWQRAGPHPSRPGQAGQGLSRARESIGLMGQAGPCFAKTEGGGGSGLFWGIPSVMGVVCVHTRTRLLYVCLICVCLCSFLLVPARIGGSV